MALGLALSFFFIFLGHSSLVYFLIEENLHAVVPSKEILMPWPKRGKFVSYFSYAVGAGLIWFTLSRFDPSSDLPLPAGSVKILFCFVLLPGGTYVWFLLNRVNVVIKENKKVISFQLERATSLELKIPAIMGATIFLLLYLF